MLKNTCREVTADQNTVVATPPLPAGVVRGNEGKISEKAPAACVLCATFIHLPRVVVMGEVFNAVVVYYIVSIIHTRRSQEIPAQFRYKLMRYIEDLSPKLGNWRCEFPCLREHVKLSALAIMSWLKWHQQWAVTDGEGK
ncbi:jg9494 [Pararge aegeria aegeria]|uniref:Jg9494 protein n=1 Tax=Pararge aegeria aegeria TaxID=348720 RepID=A0A8S4RK74_9NEOP|nr:jg9494 [Pararge aegeria aegeria]